MRFNTVIDLLVFASCEMRFNTVMDLFVFVRCATLKRD